jgi:hypothetical protein
MKIMSGFLGNGGLNFMHEMVNFAPAPAERDMPGSPGAALRGRGRRLLRHPRPLLPRRLQTSRSRRRRRPARPRTDAFAAGDWVIAEERQQQER